jgi:Flavodoxin reductases (ferredoxin-NADPH reductases) family 1
MVWQAGQYLHYTLRHDQEDDRGSERWFTIAAPPFERRPRITTRLAAESSSFKQALVRLPLGGVIEADGPEGDFVVDDPEHDYVFIAGGIGITPFRAILLQLDHDRVSIHAHLLYATHQGDEPVFRRELDGLSARHPAFRVEYVTGPHRIGKADIRAAGANLHDPFYYVAGPEPMVKHYEEMLTGMGIAKDRIKVDDFPGYEAV